MARVFPWVMTGLIVAGLAAAVYLPTGSLVAAAGAGLAATSFVRPGRS